MLFSAFYNSPIGGMHIFADDHFITKIIFSDQPIAQNSNRLTDLATTQLASYFEGNRKIFDLPITLSGTPFQQKVFALVEKIPFGKTLSYAQLSQQFGDEKAIRAVAAANGKNQFAIVVPCHRVMGANGNLTGYAWGIEKKQRLLALEGSSTLALL